jgi:hypothetical protein
MLWQEGFFIFPPSEISYFSTDNLLNRNLAGFGQICGAALAAGVLE